MPSKIDPNDWDRFFSADGPKHQGPLGILFSILIILGFFGAVGYGGVSLKRITDQRNATAAAELTAYSLTTLPGIATQAAANQTATAQGGQPTGTPNLPTGRVLSQANLRLKPGEAEEKKGDLFPNDLVQFVESQDVEGQTWWRIRVIGVANAQAGVAEGTTGWVIGSALSEQTAPPPVAAATATSGPPPIPAITIPPELVAYRDQQTGITLQQAPGWQALVIEGIDRSIRLAPGPESLEGIVAALLPRPARDEASLRAGAQQVAKALSKPGTEPQIIDAAPASASGQLDRLTGAVTFTRVFNGQDVTIQARYEARFASNSIAVVIAYVPQGSYAPNEALLKQMTNKAIFP